MFVDRHTHVLKARGNIESVVFGVLMDFDQTDAGFVDNIWIVHTFHCSQGFGLSVCEVCLDDGFVVVGVLDSDTHGRQEVNPDMRFSQKDVLERFYVEAHKIGCREPARNDYVCVAAKLNKHLCFCSVNDWVYCIYSCFC